jgi:hypothetical protein
MTVDGAKIRRWLGEEEFKVTAGQQPESTFSFNIQTSSGLQMVVWQPRTKADAVVISGSIGLRPDDRTALAGHEDSLLWVLRYALLQTGSIFEMHPQEGVPERVTVMAQIWEDGLTKTAFLNAVQKVVNGLVLVIVTIQHEMTPSD